MMMLALPVMADSWAPRATAGAVCRFASYHFGAIGLALPTAAGAEGDRPGAHGNEVKQIYRVLYRPDSGPPQLAGWILQSFDDRYDFSAAELDVTGENVGAYFLPIGTPHDSARLPLNRWVTQLEQRSGKRWSATVPAADVPTIVQPCFSSLWNGRDH
jgi:hypothetical protein